MSRCSVCGAGYPFDSGQGPWCPEHGNDLNPNKFSHILFRLLDIDGRQAVVLYDWMQSLPQHHAHEGATTENHPFNVTMYDTGIGPVIYVWTNIDGKKYSCHLGYDDDGILPGAIADDYS